MNGAMFSSRYKQLLLGRITSNLGQSANLLAVLQQQLLELYTRVERSVPLSPVQCAEGMNALDSLSSSAEHICAQLKELGRHPGEAGISRHPLLATLCYIKEQAGFATGEMLALCFLEVAQVDEYDRQRSIVHGHLKEIVQANDAALDRMTSLLNQAAELVPAHVASTA